MSVTLEQVQEGILKVGLLAENITILNEKIANLPNVIIPSMPYVVLNADKTGAIDATDAIINATNHAVANKTYMVVFPTGNYLVRPDRMVVPENVEWISFGNAVLFTKETALYNIIVSMRTGSRITHLTFDQRQDAAMTPQPGATSPKGLFIIHMPNLNDATVQDCTFYSCGVCTIIIQQQFTGLGYNINILRNKIRWQRKVESEFDATMIFADVITGRIAHNDIKAEKTSVTNGWKFETGIEAHSPDLLVEDNHIDGCVNGILPTAWPGLYPAFDDLYRGSLRILNNVLTSCVRGISYWGAPINNTNTVARNALIQGNYINLKLEKRPKTSYYYPAEGIGLEDHSNSTATFAFKNIQIRSNRIETTYETGLNARALMDYGPSPAPQVGAFNMQTKYPCENIDISDNDIDFPLPIFNLKAIGSAVHKNIRAYNNRLWNPAIYHAYLSNGFDGIYNLENLNGLIASNNTIYGTPIEIVQKGVNVSNVSGV
jgi:hypothetical protein